MESFEIITIERDGLFTAQKAVCSEIPFTMELNGTEIATVLASPSNLDELAIGFLFTSGLIQGKEDIKSLIPDMDSFKVSVRIDGIPDNFVFRRIYTSGCGRGVIFHNPLDVLGKAPLEDGFTLPASKLVELMKEFSRNPISHGESGGVHGAALASEAEILIVREDIGRHNAIDKVIGAALAAGISMHDKVLLTTGRISSEIFSKVLRARFPVIAALGSATDQAVKLARVTNITLVSKLKGMRGDIFSAPHRIQSCSINMEETNMPPLGGSCRAL